MKFKDFLQNYTKGNVYSVFCKNKKESEAFLNLLIENNITKFLGGLEINPKNETMMYPKGTYYNYLKVSKGTKPGSYSGEKLYIEGLEYGKKKSILSDKVIKFSELERD